MFQNKIDAFDECPHCKVQLKLRYISRPRGKPWGHYRCPKCLSHYKTIELIDWIPGAERI
jgi:hypothetical protein